MKRINVEIDGSSVGDLYRQLRHIAEEISLGAVEGEGAYAAGFEDDLELPYFFRIIDLEDQG